MPRSDRGKMSISKRTAGLSALASIAALGSMVAMAVPAEASSFSKGEILCTGTGYLCIQRVTTPTSTVEINAWADTKTFTGKFELITPDGQGYWSPEKTWPAGGTHYTFDVPTEGGYYSVTAWRGDAVSPIGAVSFEV
jgi:hypothetical protein